MLKRKIIGMGNSLGITIPPAVLEHMGIKKGDIVGVSITKIR